MVLQARSEPVPSTLPHGWMQTDQRGWIHTDQRGWTISAAIVVALGGK
jgi:hypothetical protein